jgi:ABC-type multidrug transport system ATPase subunit
MTICRLDGVTAGYRRDSPVMSGVTILIEPGLTVLSGPNGSGKSTMVELFAGSLRPFQGAVSVLGQPAHDPAVRAHRAVCRSAPALYPVLTAAEHVALLRGVRKVDDHELAERISAYQLGPWWHVPTSELSTGNLRKAWIILTTLTARDLMVFDEPFNGLDAEGIETLTGELGRWCADDTTGRAVVVVAHHPPAALESLAARTVRLRPGMATPAAEPATVGSEDT